MPSVQRYDSVPIRDYHFDDQTSFLYVYRVPIAGAMVQKYVKSDGSEEMEAKLPEEILSDSTVSSANSKPVTDGHHGLVTKDNSHDLMKGFTASNGHVEGNMLYNDITITDPNLISQIKSGDKRELSIGFETQMDPTSGTYNGTKYDAVQRNIRINHVAVVPKGRAGHEVRLIGDSAEAVEQVEPSEEKGNQMETRVVRADGQNITVAADDVEKITKLDADNSAKAKQIADLDAQIKKLKAEKAQLQGNADEANKKADSLETDNEKLKEQINHLKGDAFDERLNLIDKVKSFVGDSDYDYHGKTDRDLKIDAVKAIKGDSIDFEDKSDAYVQAAFDMLEKPKQVSGYAGPDPETKGDSQDVDLMALRDASYGY
ncbi:DUF2213 domain-containing protein [Lactobacillus crispatus]|uniref:DUF2213 domain-containing protein n=1 Tax=Lactobacillus crispatus TaxID=47770 RepID=UPI0022AC0D64|nr:DUF2213 domain-containing protein [Lactobacillus crispatus]MCZ3846416.1 DUF2213 domain-containing protein [Lactobacillus crispatus]MCZ3848684.1 DUF2213 domain-containing protein [Lactobacillus crispatus]MCZ3854621.1 DUF2213 domain-containing protein [Lactobacillus crispatus]MCZ3856898.1 DUF2213 domain-containing protein [Lactobacillus crispatus]MCZ3859140.1 DUF2213 domain-containing protein [Lactobacillus crispatus]